MPNVIYDWKRFWCPREGQLRRTAEGYLLDPEADYGNYFNPDVVSFNDIANKPCLILLGEPGIGKSTEIKKIFNEIIAESETGGDVAMLFNLKNYDTGQYLCDELFDENIDFQTWLTGSNYLHLFLDSLDEGLLSIKTLASLLGDRLISLPIERLLLRIACRTAVWPESLDQSLLNRWGKANFGAYELAPLRKIDVQNAALANGVETEAFLAAIAEREVGPLAAKPLTLRFLMAEFLHKQALQATRADLYESGCRYLCEETSESRRASGHSGFLSSDERFSIAARVAANIVLCNRNAIWAGIHAEAPPDDLSLRDFGADAATQAGVRETLNTGLFSSRGTNRMGWEHQTYAEFLAAHFIKQTNMPLKQVMSLLWHPEGKLVPQLHETAAWLAGMDSQIFEEILKSDPIVLLRSDVSAENEHDKQRILAAILGIYERNEMRDFSRHDYSKFKYSGLADQLRPYIIDASKGWLARSVAVDIAEVCDLKELQDDILQVALNASEPHDIRENAAYAILRIASSETKAKMRPLAFREAGDDPNDELKGIALAALRPDNLSVDELFSILHRPSVEDRIGGPYWEFLHGQLVDGLTIEDLPRALRWVQENPPLNAHLDPFDDTRKGILLRAWGNLDAPEVLTEMARVFSMALESHSVIYNNPLWERAKNDTPRRRALIEAIISELATKRIELMNVFYSEASSLFHSDVDWLIEKCNSSDSNEKQCRFARLIGEAVRFSSSENYLRNVIAVADATKVNPVLKNEMADLLIPMRLDSPEAIRLRDNYSRNQEWREKHRRENPPLTPPPAERVAQLLASCESSNPSAWWRITWELQLEPTDTQYQHLYEPDLTKLPGWREADEITRNRIIGTAFTFLTEADPNLPEWLGLGKEYYPAQAGYKALALLLKESPNLLESLPLDTWRRWSPMTLACRINGGDEEQEQLVSLAYKNAPCDVLATFRLLITEESAQHNGYLFSRRHIISCWDKDIAAVLVSELRAENWPLTTLECILEPLLQHQVPEAREFAKSILLNSDMTQPEGKACIVSVASALMRNAEDAAWADVWPILEQNDDLSRAIIFRIADRTNEPSLILQKLNEEQLASLYSLLLKSSPPTPDPSISSVDIFRNSVHSALLSRGTWKACQELRNVAREFPQHEWLKWYIADAEKQARASTWQHPLPSVLLEMTSNSAKRLVNSGDQLLDVIIDSLNRLQEDLQGELASAESLWNDNPCQPRNEKVLSNFIARHLKKELKDKCIIVSREVEIRTGEKTDIHVDAFNLDSTGQRADVISAIIEVKGCWHNRIYHDIECQLVGKYLKDNQCQHGLYLVGWFNCDSWNDPKDLRLKSAKVREIGDMRKKLEEKANELSTGGLRVSTLVLDASLKSSPSCGRRRTRPTKNQTS